MKKKIFFISSSIQFYENFLYKTLTKLNHNYDIHICTNLQLQTLKFTDIKLIDLNISRKISIIKDILCIIKLLKILSNLNPDIIISSSPKGSLIVAFTTLFYRCRRFHILTGLIWSGKTNMIKKLIYKYLDLIFLYTCEKIFVDSPSQIQFLKKEKFYYKKLSLINEGSIQGVDLIKFQKVNDNSFLRKKFGFRRDQIILLFLGRISPEKGIYYFLDLINTLTKSNKSIFGVIVGRDEKKILSKHKKYNFDFDKNFFYFPYTNNPEFFIQSCDIMIIPSEREGFCQAAIEGSACGIPLIGFDVIGLKDSIFNNDTGYLIPYGDKLGLEEITKHLIDNPKLRKKMGTKGINKIKEKFDQSNVVSSFVNQITSAINYK